MKHMMRLPIASLFFFLFYFSAKAQKTTNLAEPQSYSFVEENLKEQGSVFDQDSNITEPQFQEIISVVKNEFQPDAEKAGLELKISGFWKDTTINANMTRMVGKIIISVYGGIARRPEVTATSFAAILCHEVGHGLAGKPWSPRPLFLISAEGQSDYFAFQKCLSRVIPQLKDSAGSGVASGNFEHRELCEKRDQLGSDSEIELCQAKLQAGVELGNLLSFIKSQPKPHYDTPDITVVKRTLLGYPKSIQCRLDTFLAGAVNDQRPKCWFAGN